MKIRDMDMFIRAVKIVRVSAPAKQKSIDSQNLFEAENDRNGTTLADQNRRLPEGCFHCLARGCQPIAGRIKDEGFTTVRSLEFELNSRRTIYLQKLFKSIQNFRRVHLWNQSARNLRDRSRRNNGLWTFALITARDTVDIAGWSSGPSHQS